MFHIGVALLAILCALIWGDLKNWRLYYPTILFCVLGDAIHLLITYNFTLWKYESRLFPSILTNLLVTMTVFPSFCLIFLPRHPM
jgi:hypothetical protein